MTSPDQNYTSWHVGMKVVCIATPEQIAVVASRLPAANYPKPDGVYTIREIRDDAVYGAGGVIVLLLNEIDNSHFIGTGVKGKYFNYVEPGFRIKSFRPVQTRQTSIEVFTAMLSPKPAKAGKVRA